MTTNTSAKLSGKYQISVIRNAGQTNEYIEDYPEFKNLLLDAFFSRYSSKGLSQNNWRFFVGTGTTPPTTTDTQLENQLGGASNPSSNTATNVTLDGSDYVSELQCNASWALGSIVGNITEIGASMFTSTTGLDLQTRALIVDGVGVPTPIQLTVDDQLVVNYTLRMVIPTAQTVTVHNFEGVPTTCTLEVLNIFGTGSWGISTLFGTTPWDITTLRASSSLTLYNDITANNNTTSTYVVTDSSADNGSGTLRLTISASPSQLNVSGGIKYLILCSSSVNARQGILFDPPLNKTSEKTLQLYFDYTITRA